MDTVNAIGRRKAAIARIYLSDGKGNITINDRKIEEYFPLLQYQYLAKQALLVTGLLEKFDIKANLEGGGIKGQAEAVRLGIARAIIKADAEQRPILKSNGFLTRDARVVERKKPGRKKARKRFQFSKR
ncbi:MAG: 30S ribosomal protein S9 [Bacteroidales bacterium]|nr:30S ribosomal protein S9 [Bacteroidales bacterium]HOY37788.1 30S ribosomal protein S9 [Bacteroidales bacterium]HQP03572.1 30S ribosomal protein S9 [Bacteroidales bacterium]